MKRFLLFCYIAVAAMFSQMTSPSVAEARGACDYHACESSCPSEQAHILFCEQYSISKGCSLSSGGCRSPEWGGCAPFQVLVYCNINFEQ